MCPALRRQEGRRYGCCLSPMRRLGRSQAVDQRLRNDFRSGRGASQRRKADVRNLHFGVGGIAALAFEVLEVLHQKEEREWASFVRIRQRSEKPAEPSADRLVPTQSCVGK